MANTSINIIGAGRLGKTLGRLLVAHGQGTVLAVCNRSAQSTAQAIEFIGEGSPVSQIADLPPADLVLMTTSDDVIESCARELSLSPNLAAKTIALHCSGSLSSEILQPLRARGCLVASLHPARSFSDPSVSVGSFAGTYCALEGDNPAVFMLREVVKSLGGVCFEIDPKHKALYHVAGVFGTNYVVTLFNQALQCLEEAGVDNATAKQVVQSFMEGALHNLQAAKVPADALTGPIKRGDVSTLARHIEAITNKATSELYSALGLATLEIADLLESQRNPIAAMMSAAGITAKPITKASDAYVSTATAPLLK
jgi:predicted short-subunit dehydrogenase-like oxidoreductase (DUF2520 family)